MQIHDLTNLELVFPNLPGQNAAAVLREFSLRLATQGVVDDADALYQRLLEREELGSTGLGGGVAIPHCKYRKLDRVIVAVATCAEGVEFGAADQQPVRLLFLVISPEKTPAAHLQSLAAISKWVKADHHVERILEASDAESIFALLGEQGGEA